MLTAGYRLSFTDTIEVLVGEEKRSFLIHKDIVSSPAPFFEAACSERWLDKSGTVALPDDDALGKQLAERDIKKTSSLTSQ